MNTHEKQDTSLVYFVDKFFVPKESAREFKNQMNYNRNFLKSLPGFIRSDAMELTDADGNLTIVTVALWENLDYINRANTSMQAEFKRTNFNPVEFYQRLNIKMERHLYNAIQE